MPVNIGATLNHISRESSDIRRLADFYKEIFGFEEIEAPNFGEFKVIWLNLPGAFALHLIERNPGTKLPEGPYSTTSPTADPSHLPRGHHICFTVSDFDSFLQTLKDLKGAGKFGKALRTEYYYIYIYIIFNLGFERCRKVWKSFKNRYSGFSAL
ncbi:hypothetical protein CICLE_v10006131mg [Citrus x clementina]|uniref:VOC domain-containing protein n=2 Tax=Citrus TaxID=2706 RepID=V4RZ83_CITCL|nr:hypothetical protein CICLE_v10006131mg [Citrus x clementina]